VPKIPRDIEAELLRRIEISRRILVGVPGWCDTDGWQMYVNAPARHIAKAAIACKRLKMPHGGSIYDIGVGCGYLLYLCREWYGCTVAGCDVNIYYQKMFAVTRLALGLWDCVEDRRIQPMQPLGITGRYDRITSTSASFSRGWTEPEHRCLLGQLPHILTADGCAFLTFSGKDFEKPDIAALYAELNTMPAATQRIRPWDVLVTRERLESKREFLLHD